MTIDGAQAAIRLVIADALVKNSEIGGRAFDALFAMRQADAVSEPSTSRDMKSGG